jgi:hypothetical protein
VPALALGLTFLLGQLTGGGVAIGGLVLGLLLAGAGACLLRRRYLAAAGLNSTLIQGRHILGIHVGSVSVDVPRGAAIGLHGERAPWVLSLVENDQGSEFARTYDLSAARRWGATLANVLGCAWRDAGSERLADTPRRFKLPTTETGRMGLLLFIAVTVGMPWAAWWTWQKPDVRERAALAAVAPLGGIIEFDRMPAVRAWAAQELAAQQTAPSLLGLIRLLNTIDPERDADVAAAAMDALRAAAGHAAGSGAWNEQLARANLWVAEQTGRTLDAHGGVLGWFAVAPEFQRTIDVIAGDDPHAAWSAWSSFGAGTLTTPEAFLFAAGGALADPRPIAFEIRRTSPPGMPLRFEGQPRVPAGSVLARTVGEALALRLWQYDGIYSESMTEDFGPWWDDYARRRLLPPVSRTVH